MSAIDIETIKGLDKDKIYIININRKVPYFEVEEIRRLLDRYGMLGIIVNSEVGFSIAEASMTGTEELKKFIIDTVTQELSKPRNAGEAIANLAKVCQDIANKDPIYKCFACDWEGPYSTLKLGKQFLGDIKIPADVLLCPKCNKTSVAEKEKEQGNQLADINLFCGVDKPCPDFEEIAYPENETNDRLMPQYRCKKYGSALKGEGPGGPFKKCEKCIAEINNA